MDVESRTAAVTNWQYEEIYDELIETQFQEIALPQLLTSFKEMLQVYETDSPNPNWSLNLTKHSSNPIWLKCRPGESGSNQLYFTFPLNQLSASENYFQNSRIYSIDYSRVTTMVDEGKYNNFRFSTQHSSHWIEMLIKFNNGIDKFQLKYFFKNTLKGSQGTTVHLKGDFSLSNAKYWIVLRENGEMYFFICLKKNLHLRMVYCMGRRKIYGRIEQLEFESGLGDGEFIEGIFQTDSYRVTIKKEVIEIEENGSMVIACLYPEIFSIFTSSHFSSLPIEREIYLQQKEESLNYLKMESRSSQPRKKESLDYLHMESLSQPESNSQKPILASFSSLLEQENSRLYSDQSPPISPTRRLSFHSFGLKSKTYSIDRNNSDHNPKPTIKNSSSKSKERRYQFDAVRSKFILQQNEQTEMPVKLVSFQSISQSTDQSNPQEK